MGWADATEGLRAASARVAAEAPLFGRRVVLHHTGRSEFAGLFGLATDYIFESGDYVVKLDEVDQAEGGGPSDAPRDPIRVPPHLLRPAPTYSCRIFMKLTKSITSGDGPSLVRDEPFSHDVALVHISPRVPYRL